MIKWINKKRNQKGFTLIELIVVIAILGILAAIAIPRLAKSRDGAEVTAHNANVRTIESAVSLYQADNNKLPATIEDLIPEYLADEIIDPRNKKTKYKVTDGVVAPAAVPIAPETESE